MLEYIKKGYTVLFFLALIVATVVFSKKPLMSADLKIDKQEEGDTVRRDYVDEKGIIHTAFDKGYATRIVHYKDGLEVLDEYFDEDMNPVMLQGGYSAIKREYENGLNTVITYLDTQHEPVVINAGYDSIHRSFYDTGVADTDIYFIGDTQVERTEEYWQYKRIYNFEGKISEIRYLDKDGMPVLNKNGFAVLKREFNSRGKVSEERYFDTEGRPAASTLGEYGFFREYDDQGRIIRTTYIGADGEVANTNLGYAILSVSYEDGETIRYFDAEGKPVTIGRGQYGIHRVNGKSIYIDENGDDMLRLDNILNTNQWMVVIVGIVVTVIAALIRKKYKFMLGIAYLGFIFYMTLVYRETGEPHGAFDLFWSYKQFFTSPTLRQSLINNIWLFVPMGALLFSVDKYEGKLALTDGVTGILKKAVYSLGWGWCFILSAFIEITQWLTGKGLAEFDDVFSNTLGALIGFLFSVGVFNIKKIYKLNHEIKE